MGPCCIRKIDNIGCMIKNSSNRPEKVIFSHVKPIWLFVGKNFRFYFFLRHFGVDLSTVYDSVRIFLSDTIGHSTRRFWLFFCRISAVFMVCTYHKKMCSQLPYQFIKHLFPNHVVFFILRIPPASRPLVVVH